MAEAPLSRRGPIIVHARLTGPRTSHIIAMALDTGAVLTIMPVEIARAIGYDPARAAKRAELITASGMELVPILTVRKVTCLGQTVPHVEVACHNLPAESPVQGLLGLNFLRHFSLGLDFPGGRISIQRAAQR